MATIIYHNSKFDARHKHLGIFVDIDNCFHDPVGPFPSSDRAAQWISENADCLIELYGPSAATVVRAAAL